MSPTRLAWNPLRANTRTAASRSWRRLSSTAWVRSTKAGRSLLRRLSVCRRRRGRRDVLDGSHDPPDRLLQVTRDDPDLVRLALRDQRQRLEVLILEQFG